MKNRKLRLSDIIFIVFIILFIVPQTRRPILVMANKVRAKFSSLTVVAKGEQEQLGPFTYTLDGLDGENLNVDIGRGEVVFISYWATWCPPCIAEFPSIDALYKDYGDKINFVMISNEDPEKIRKFLKKKNFAVPAVIPKMEPPKDLYEKTIPTNYIIDHTGKIIVKEKGALDWNSQKVRKVLDDLIAKKESDKKQKTLSLNKKGL
ncbi:TlpA disulfide reductase family protein [Maribacter sp. PR1]|uniref:TlpA disulfide reductase family protein n=1 Tax=Maribacter cobaltidurans TaxID=1178778 RepID=A0ABU7IR79_9FLAO|nr:MULTISPECIES: TlpA disulfide reductase family protein [Maribacter]MDC6388067.1 TlpA disulfide reductase family protein [Maribacter sp. PR1]MEE1975455.1 TlpA disulfide reductase family protein [Maribacter cobaltidurans]